MNLYLRALRYFRPDLRRILLLLLLIGLSTGLALLVAWPMAVLVDSVISPHPKSDRVHQLFLSILPDHRLGQVVGLAIMGLLIKLMQDLLSMLQAVQRHQVDYNGLMRVRCDLYRKLQALNLDYHRSHPQGDAIYRLSSDTFGCQTILSAVISALVAAVTLVAMAGILLSRNVTLTLMAFSITPALVVVNLAFAKRLRARSLECREVDTQFTSTVQRSIACIGLVQAFGREEEEFGRFQASVLNSIRSWWRLNWQQMRYNLLIGAIFGLGGAMVFGYGGYLVWRDQFAQPAPHGMTVGDLMIFTAYLGMLWGPLCSLTGFVTTMQNGAAGAARVFEVLDRDPVICDGPDALPLPRQPRTLKLEGVSFQYAGQDRPVLHDIDVTILPGEMVAFVGSSGAGKSTLLNLLPRFYDPTSGVMKLDGIDARRIRVADLRRHVALVLQETVILPTTIAENIAYGRPSALAAEIRQAAQLSGAAEFIEVLPEGYNTVIAEGGSNLSGGQKQRIAIARSLLTEAPFIILDEPTSAQDPHNEQIIMQVLRSLKGQRTIILVSHRLCTVMDCDRVHVVHQGLIAESGNPLRLLAQNGLFAQMARIQQITATRNALHQAA
jgi:ABC-type multidrug transport system fused ATPase/permease subunit